MSESLNEYVSYEPPKSACFGHQTRIKNARSAWPLVESFLEKRTTSTLNEHISLRCVLPFSGPVDVFNAYRSHANNVLGTCDEGTWHFTPAQLKEALNLSFEEDLWPRQSAGGPACLSFSYTFAWKAPFEPLASGLPITSRLNVLIEAQRIFLQPHFIFPWSWSSSELREFLCCIQGDLPLDLREQYFKRLVSTKSGGSRALKLPKGWMNAAQQQVQGPTSPPSAEPRP